MQSVVASIEESKRGTMVAFECGEAFWFTRAMWREHEPMAVGMEEDVDALRQWLLPRQYMHALNDAVALLAVRARAKGEIEQRLNARRYMPDTVEMVLYKLEKEGLLDDEAFARDWAASRARKQVGKHRIMQELRMKGLPTETAEQAVEALDEEESGAAAVALSKKLLRRYQDEPDERRAMQKLMAAMARRGYGWDDAKEAVETAMQELACEDDEM